MADERRTARIYIDDKDAQAALKRLQGEATHLRKRLEEVPNGSKEFRQIEKRLVEVSKNMAALNREGAKVQGMFGSIGKMAGAFGIGSLLADGVRAAARAVGDFIGGSVDLFRGQEKAVAKVEQGIRSTGMAAGLSLDELTAKASELQNRTLFGDEEILNNATAQLLTFTNIAGDQFLRTQQAALDLSTVLDGDLKSASIQLGKALNDPKANLSALSRSGIQFSEEQKKLIFSLQETNRMAEAQTVILNELERQYGGQAEAAAKADGGAKQLSNAWGDMQEKVGELLNEVFNLEEGNGLLLEAVQWLTEGVGDLIGYLQRGKDYFTDWYKESGLLRGGVQAFFLVLKNGWEVVKVVFRTIGDGLADVVSGVKALRLVTQGEFSKAFEEIGTIGRRHADTFKKFGQGIAGNFREGMEEVVNPKMFSEVAEKAQEGVAPIKLDIDPVLDPDAEKKAEEERKKVYQKVIQERRKLQEQLQAINRDLELNDVDKDQRELERVVAKYDKLREQAKGNTEQLLEIERLQGIELAQVWEKQATDRVKAEEELQKKVAELRMTFRQAGMQAEQQAIEAEQALAEARAAGVVEDEIRQADMLAQMQVELFERRMELLEEQRMMQEEQEQLKYEAQLASAAENNLSTEEIEAAHQLNMQTIRENATAEELKLQQQRNAAVVDAEKKKNTAIQAIQQNTLSAMSSLFQLAAEDASEFADFQKALALVQIGVDTATSISQITAKGYLSSLDPLTAAVKITTAIAFALGNMVKAKALLSQETPKAPQFAAGGDTFKDGGNVGRPTLAWVGEAGPEYVSPNWMYSHPALAPTFAQLERIRRSGYVPQAAYADGGPTGQGAVGGEMAAMLAMVGGAVQQLNAQLAAGITATQNYDLQREFEERITRLNQGANITR